MRYKKYSLALAELRSTTCCLQTVLLTLLHTRIAGQETSGLQGGAVLLVDLQQSAGDAVADGAGLAGHAAAGDGSNDVNLAHQLGGDQGLTNDQLQGIQTEVNVDGAAGDGDGASAILKQVDTGDGGLPAAGAIELRLLALIHDSNPPLTRRPRSRASERHARARRHDRRADGSESPCR